VNFALVAPSSLRSRLRPGADRVRRLPGKGPGFALLALAGVVLFHGPAWTKTKSSLSFASRTAGVRPDRVRSDRAYISALAAANRFLQAWQNQDHETGLLMLTDEAKQRSSEDRTESFFSSGAEAAYEIARGKRTKAGRYAFPVTLFPFHSGTAKSDRPQKSEIVVVQTGKDEWAIDRLP
jgi:hypothetical protein